MARFWTNRRRYRRRRQRRRQRRVRITLRRRSLWDHLKRSQLRLLYQKACLWKAVAAAVHTTPPLPFFLLLLLEACLWKAAVAAVHTTPPLLFLLLLLEACLRKAAVAPVHTTPPLPFLLLLPVASLLRHPPVFRAPSRRPGTGERGRRQSPRRRHGRSRARRTSNLAPPPRRRRRRTTRRRRSPFLRRKPPRRWMPTAVEMTGGVAMTTTGVSTMKGAAPTPIGSAILAAAPQRARRRV
ncbi:unnamed protein product, partial [Ectocarpus fasciculatus]